MKPSSIKMSALVEAAELKNFYTPQLNEELKTSIQEDGLKTPIVITKNYILIDGYRRVDAYRELGHEYIRCVFVDDQPTLQERITRNMTREKSPQDIVNEWRQVFLRYPKKQGKRNNDGSPYVRDQKISEALGGKFKGDVIVNKLEKILFNDLEGDILSKGIVQKNWKVDTCYDFLLKWKEIDDKYGYGITIKLLNGEITVLEANRLIRERESLEKHTDTFIIPEKAASFNIDCINFGSFESYRKSVALLFSSIPYYQLRFYENGDTNQSGHEETKQEYCERIARYFKELLPTLKDSANVMINIGETYDNGVGLGIPDLLKDAIEKITGLVYKDRIVWSKSNPKPQNESIKRPINNVEYILWFVVDPKKAKYNLLTYTDGSKNIEFGFGAKDAGKEGGICGGQIILSKPYKKIYTHLKEQDIQNIIKAKTGKNHDVYNVCSEGHPAIMSAVLPVIPILMTTDEEDIVLDAFSGSNVVGRMSCLLNRRAVSCELSKQYFNIGCKMLENSVKDFDRSSLNVIHEIAYCKGNNSIIAQKESLNWMNDDHVEYLKSPIHLN